MGWIERVGNLKEGSRSTTCTRFPIMVYKNTTRHLTIDKKITNELVEVNNFTGEFFGRKRNMGDFLTSG
jgi:hypothetical protein